MKVNIGKIILNMSKSVLPFRYFNNKRFCSFIQQKWFEINEKRMKENQQTSQDGKQNSERNGWTFDFSGIENKKETVHTNNRK